MNHSQWMQIILLFHRLLCLIIFPMFSFFTIKLYFHIFSIYDVFGAFHVQLWPSFKLMALPSRPRHHVGSGRSVAETLAMYSRQQVPFARASIDAGELLSARFECS